MIRSIRSVFRLLRTARILAHFDALFLLEKLDVTPGVVLLARLVSRRRVPGRPGERLAQALTRMGPTFIKLGQALATRSDLLGEEICRDLTKLQDRLPPFPGREARAIIEAELGHPIDQMFARFDDEPIAAASIAQVHFAETIDGHQVAVKVLRPGIEEAFARDLDMMRWLAETAEATRPEMRRLKPVESVATFAEAVHFEMDLRFEASAAAEMTANFADDPDLQVPAVHWHLTGQRVMTAERFNGIRVDDLDALKAAGHDPSLVLERLATGFFRQVFRDGFFHGDLHPGNMFVLEDGAIGVVDFGIIGRLDRPSRLYLGEMLMAFLTRDYRRAAEIHFEAGYVPQSKSVDSFTQACRSIAEPILDLPQDQISMARLLAQLFRITETFEMETQPQLLLLQKTMLVAEGVGRKLNPSANMWMLAQPLIEDWILDNLGPEAKLRDAVVGLAAAVHRLPRVLAGLEKVAEELADGGLQLHPETVRALRGNRRTTQVLPWMISALLAAALVAALISG